MKKLAIALLSLALVAPSIDARGRNNTGNNPRPATTTTQRAPARPGNAKPGGNNNSARPGNTNPGKPGNSGNHGGNHGPNNGGGNHGGNQGNHGSNNFAPGGGPGHGPGGPGPGHGPGGPGHNHGHGPGGPGPGHHHGPGPAYGVPYRPYMPVGRPWARPVPPPHYRPVGNPFFSTILGLTIGTTINIALNNLIANGYTVSGYGNDAIYLNNVRQLNMLWPNATLYYLNGLLQGGEYVYSTPYYDLYRYNMAYNSLVASYGMPYDTQMLPGGGMQCNWWGPGGQYITLNFSVANAYNGSSRYFTTLTIGQ